MDSAYDHIQEESYPQQPPKQPVGQGDDTASSSATSATSAPPSFNTEVQEAYKAISSSPWAARLGGFLGTVKKQGEQYYDTASKQYASTSKNATAGVSTLIGHARNLSIQPTEGASDSAEKGTSAAKDKEEITAHPDRPDSLPADIVREAEGMLARLRTEATKRFKDLEKAEDAADEALLKFGSNIRSFLSDAVSIAPPAAGSEADKKGAVLFESKDSSGKKVVHATRFDAQLHVIHSTLDSFLKDPVSPQWADWQKNFDAEKKTDAIAADLEKHAELRSAMEKAVPEKVDYPTFWCRYYYLRHVIESEEQRRRELLKASNPTADEEVAWDEDSDDETAAPAKPSPAATTTVPSTSTTTTTTSPATPAPTSTPPTSSSLDASKETLKPTAVDSLKPAQPRRSNDEKSVADSDASYDLVSGATSRAPGSPREPKKVVEESDEEDWE